ncbi:MAG TPA: retropepsin-like aspartic protease, partial [Mucilaginibacter sp.]|nr:retropepsin-like aspartic protease [Mucilaginibacter sp.]
MKKFYTICLTASALITGLCNSVSAQNKLAFSVPFKLVDNRPFIEVKIKGKIFHLVVDCGAMNSLDLGAAKALGLKLISGEMQSGAGAKKVQSWTARVDTASFGSAKITQKDFIVADLSEIRIKLHLPYIDGAIGYDFMKNYAVQFDYPKQRINFYYTYKSVNPIPYALFWDQLPKINATIDSKPALLIFDTGDRTALTIFNHYAEKTGIKKRYKLSDTTITGYGIGGPIYAQTMTLKQLGMGHNKIADVPSRIPTLKSGAFSSTEIDGSIGGG